LTVPFGALYPTRIASIRAVATELEPGSLGAHGPWVPPHAAVSLTRARARVPLLVALSAALYGLAFPPLSLSAAAWVTLAPFLVAVAGLSPWRAAAAGMLLGVTASCTVAWWLPGMLEGYFAAPRGLSWVAVLAIGVGMVGIYFAAFGAWVAWLAARQAVTPWRIAAGWVVCEFARMHLLITSPLALIGYSQAHVTPLVQIADATGPYGIGLLIALVNASAAAILVPRLRGRRPVLEASTVVGAVVAALLYGQWRLAERFADGPPVNVAVVAGVAAAQPSTPAQRRANLERYVAATRTAAAGGAVLAIWPEYAIDVYLQEASWVRRELLALSRDTGIDLVVGGPHYARERGRTGYHNSAFLMRDGRFVARSDKLQLVPFAEEPRLTWLLPARPVAYEPGGEIRTLPAALRIGALMCGESMLPDLTRRITSADAELLANLSNDGWFGHEAGARQQLDSAALRAVENRRYLLRATTSGVSAIIDPWGRALATSAFDRAEVLAGVVHASHASTPYQRWGDLFAWLAAAFVVAASIRVVNNHRGGRE
jgi:apolipoprotein N-acyltransferase